MKTLLLGGLTSLWGALVFLIALHVNFPGDAALKRAQWEVQTSTDGQWAIDADDAGLYGIIGAQVENLRVYRADAASLRRAKRDNELPVEASQFLKVDQATVRLGILPLLVGTIEVIFDADLFGGTIEGSVGESDSQRSVVLKGSGLDLSRANLSGEDWAMDATGLASIDADLVIDTEAISESEGTFRFSIDEFAVVSANAMGLDLSPTSFSEAIVDLEIESGKANIQEARFISDLISVEFSGSITLSERPFERWRVRVDATVGLGEELDTMAKFLPTLKNARGDDEKYHFVCTGSVSNPRCREDRSVPGVKGGRSGGIDSKSPARLDKGIDSPRRMGRAGRKNRRDRAVDDPDRDEARARRLERIRERRERLRERREARAAEVGDTIDDLPEEPPMLGGPIGVGGPIDRFDDMPFDDEELGDPDGDGRPGFDPVPPNGFDDRQEFIGEEDDYGPNEY